MQRFSENLPRIAHSAMMADRASITFRTQPGPGLFWGGVESQPTSIMRHSEGESSHQLTSGSACFGGAGCAHRGVALEAKLGRRYYCRADKLSGRWQAVHHYRVREQPVCVRTPRMIADRCFFSVGQASGCLLFQNNKSQNQTG